MTVNEVGALIELSRLLSERSIANFVFQILKQMTEYASNRPDLIAPSANLRATV